jgi:hypothetical protein
MAIWLLLARPRLGQALRLAIQWLVAHGHYRTVPGPDLGPDYPVNGGHHRPGLRPWLSSGWWSPGHNPTPGMRPNLKTLLRRTTASIIICACKETGLRGIASIFETDFGTGLQCKVVLSPRTSGPPSSEAAFLKHLFASFMSVGRSQTQALAMVVTGDLDYRP